MFLRNMIVFLFMVQLPGLLFGQFTFSTGTAQTSSGSKQVRLLNDVPISAKLGKYGGAIGLTEASTGYFTVKKINGNWYLIDPEGYLFFTTGINSVSKGGWHCFARCTEEHWRQHPRMLERRNYKHWNSS